MKNTDLNAVLSYVYNEAVKLLGNKLEEAILYGSYARGDFQEDSDVDVALLINVRREELENYFDAIADIMSEVIWKYERLVNIVSIPVADFYRYRDVLPYYRNIYTDGVKLSA